MAKKKKPPEMPTESEPHHKTLITAARELINSWFVMKLKEGKSATGRGEVQDKKPLEDSRR